MSHVWVSVNEAKDPLANGINSSLGRIASLRHTNVTPYHHFVVTDRNPRRGVDETAEQAARVGGLPTVADLSGQQAIKATAHQ